MNLFQKRLLEKQYIKNINDCFYTNKKGVNLSLISTLVEAHRKDLFFPEYYQSNLQKVLSVESYAFIYILNHALFDYSKKEAMNIYENVFSLRVSECSKTMSIEDNPRLYNLLLELEKLVENNFTLSTDFFDNHAHLFEEFTYANGNLHPSAYSKKFEEIRKFNLEKHLNKKIKNKEKMLTNRLKI